jgi:hypothetical protein
MNYSQMTMSVFEKHEALASPQAISDTVMSSLAEYTLLVLAIFFVKYSVQQYLDSRVSRTGYLSLNPCTKLIMMVIKDRRVVW